MDPDFIDKDEMDDDTNLSQSLSLQWFIEVPCFRTSIKSKQSDCGAYCSCSKTGRELIQLMIRIISQSVPDKRRKKKQNMGICSLHRSFHLQGFFTCIYIYMYKNVSLLGVFKHRPLWLNMLDGFWTNFW